MLYLVGLGLKAKDLTLEGLDTINSSEHIFYEDYTSIIDWIEELEAITGKKFKKMQRSDLEEKSNQLIKLASFTDVTVLVSGDPLAATTHQSLIIEAKQKGVRTKIIHAPSILTTIGETGLWLYKFGRTTTIPKKGKLDSVREFINNNKKIGLHTLILLDIGMTAKQGIQRLIQEKIIQEKQELIACSKMGKKDQIILKNTAEELLKQELSGQPQCIVLPGKKHEMEEI